MPEGGLKQLWAELGPLAEQALAWSTSVLGAVLILAVGWIAARLAERGIRHGLLRLPQVDAMLVPVAASVARYAVIVVTLVAVLAQFGVNTASIIAVLGAAGLAIGLALQGTLQNIAAGIMLLVLRPLQVKEYVEAGSIAGTVVEVGLFTTVLRTWDGIYLSVPNGTLWTSTIKNFTRNPVRLVEVKVTVAYESDLDRALDILRSAAAADARALAEPPPQAAVLSLTDLGAQIALRCWARQELHAELLSDLSRAAKRCLQEGGIAIAVPQREGRAASG
ncbi:MAG: mechanosensitive ion channel [Alphaproteobacteria bacterium]|nr:mechanosensitive ion channel [Alphaproteobacteria bacterium]